MERRDFLKLASMTGLAVVAGGSTQSYAGYTGPLWIMIHAGGGWDVTSLCDPKGNMGAGDPSPMNHYLASAIKKAGNIPYAPLETSTALNGLVYTANDDFFQANYQDLVVINGIDNATNSHDAGTRTTWAGTLVEGKPTVAALIAAALLPGAPMSFITFGGYDATDGTTGAVRLGNLDAMKRIAYPYAMDPNMPTNGQYQSTAAQGFINNARATRYNALMASQRLPRVEKAMSMLYTSRLGANELSQLTANLPKQVDNGMLGEAQLAIAAYKSGLCVSANLESGGFDTHGDNDRGIANALQGQMQNGMGSGLLPQITAIRKYAVDQGVADNMVICVGSDFGRTNGYNAGNGKDHWSITSMLVMGAINGQKIQGNRVIGLTDATQSPITLNGQTWAADPNGIRITPGHIQRAIRKAAGIDMNPIMANYPVTVTEDLPIFQLA